MITFETNEQGETVKVTTFSNGAVIRELDRPAVDAPAPNPTEWLIDIGPFFDRFGAARMPVLLSTDPVVLAFLRDLGGRHWVNLLRPDVAPAISYMRGITIPELGTIPAPIAGLTEALQAAILTTPVTPGENMVLRKLYFGG